MEKMIKEECLYYVKLNDMGITIPWCQNYPHLHFDCEKCERYIEKNFVKVVRCKDCKFWNRYDDVQVIGSCDCYGGIYNKRETDFCSWAERREDDGNRVR